MTHANLNRILKSHSDPSAGLVVRIADALGLSLEWLMRGVGAMDRDAGEGAVTREAEARAYRTLAAIASELAAEVEGLTDVDEEARAHLEAARAVGVHVQRQAEAEDRSPKAG